MTGKPDWTTLGGRWSGQNRLWLDPSQPADESGMAASLEMAGGGRFLLMRYTWSHGETAHDGLLVTRHGAEPGTEVMVWLDSFHTGGGFMHFEREPGEALGGLGHYPAPAGPDWGWRIVLASGGPDDLTVRMYNLTPDGEEAPAVAMLLARLR